MVRKILIGTVAWVAVIAAILTAGALVLLRTPPGQDFVMSIALPRLAKEAGFGIEIAEARGAWPSQMELRGVRLTDEKGPWFEAERVSVVWRPELVLSNRYVFDAVAIQGGRLLREPETGDDTGARRPREGQRRYPVLKFGVISAKGFRIDEPLIGEALTIDLKGAIELAADGTVAAPLEIDASATELLSKGAAKLTGERIRLSARIRGAAGQRYAFEALKAESERVALSGSLVYDVATRDISSRLAGALGASFAARIDPDAQAQGPIGVELTTEGPWKSLAIGLTARVPALKIDETEVPSSTLTAQLLLSRAPRQLAGPVSIRFEDAVAAGSKSRVDLEFAWDRKSAIRLDYLSAFYRGARISGAVGLDTAKETVDARLAFDIPELKNLPIPVNARGSLTGAAAITHDGATRIIAEVASNTVEIEGVSIQGLAASSKGTPGGFAAKLAAKSVSGKGIGAAEKLSVAADVVRADGKTRLAIGSLTASVQKRPVTLAAPAALTFGEGEISLSDTQLRWGDGTLRAHARIGEEIVLGLEAASVPLPFAPYAVSGTIEIDTGRAEAGKVALTLAPAADDTYNLRAEIAGSWADDRLALQGAIAGYGHDAAFGRIEPVQLTLPLALVKHGGSFALSTNGAIGGRIAYAGKIDRFIPLFPLSEQAITGNADIDIAISGTLDSPQFAGRAAITDGNYEHSGVGIYLDRVALSAQGTAFGGRELVIRGTASDRRGGEGTPIEIDGLLGFRPKPKIAATLKLDHARVLHTAHVDADVSGALKLEGALPGAALTGYIDINGAEFLIPKSLPPDLVAVKVVDPSKAERAPEKAVALAREAPVDFPMDVRVSARQQVYVRGRGLDSEWAASLRAMGTIQDPHVDGTMTLRRGRFDFSGRPFTLSSGLVTFVPSRTADPDLALEARNQAASGTTAIITVSGRASKPLIRLTSDPPLPQDDVMALVLFGRPAERLSALQAVQVANAIATLTGTSPLDGGGAGLLDRARASLGLDLLDVSVGGEGGSSLTVGKYLRRGVFVSASPGIGDKPGAVSAEIELSKSVSVETKIGQDAQESVGINWKHDY